MVQKNKSVLNNRKHITHYNTLIIALLLAFFYTAQYMHRHVGQSPTHKSSGKNLVNECAVCHVVHADRSVLPLLSSFSFKAPEQLLLGSSKQEVKFIVLKGFDTRKANKDPPC